jgi:hypothetical protein
MTFSATLAVSENFRAARPPPSARALTHGGGILREILFLAEARSPAQSKRTHALRERQPSKSAKLFLGGVHPRAHDRAGARRRLRRGRVRPNYTHIDLQAGKFDSEWEISGAHPMIGDEKSSSSNRAAEPFAADDEEMTAHAGPTFGSRHCEPQASRFSRGAQRCSHQDSSWLRVRCHEGGDQ